MQASWGIFLPAHPDQFWGPLSPLSSEQWRLMRWWRVSECETDDVCSPSAKVKKVWHFVSVPSITWMEYAKQWSFSCYSNGECLHNEHFYFEYSWFRIPTPQMNKWFSGTRFGNHCSRVLLCMRTCYMKYKTLQSKVTLN